MSRLGTLLGLVAALASCVPELVGALPPCLPVDTVPFAQAPDELKTASLLHSVKTFESLAGRWRAPLVCPSRDGSLETFDTDLLFQPEPTADIEVEIGSKPNADGSPGSDCSHPGRARAQAQVTLLSPALPGLDGQSSVLTVTIQEQGRSDYGVAPFNASYSPELSRVWMVVELPTDRTPQNEDGNSLGLSIHFQHRPTTQSGNTMVEVQACGALLTKVSD